jgi:hypothetical protein
MTVRTRNNDIPPVGPFLETGFATIEYQYRCHVDQDF